MRFNADETHYKSKRLHLELYFRCRPVRGSRLSPAQSHPRARARAPWSGRRVRVGVRGASADCGAPLPPPGLLKSSEQKEKREKAKTKRLRTARRLALNKAVRGRLALQPPRRRLPASCSSPCRMRVAPRPAPPAPPAARAPPTLRGWRVDGRGADPGLTPGSASRRPCGLGEAACLLRASGSYPWNRASSCSLSEWLCGGPSC